MEVLQELRHPETREPLLDQIIYGTDVTHGPYTDLAPDLHLVLDGYRCITFPLFATNREVVTRQIRGDSGCHRSNGIFIGCGPAFQRDKTVDGSQIIDLAPTMLYLLGLPVPRAMDGRVLNQALVSELVRAHPVRFASSDGDLPDEEMVLPEEDAAEIEDRLRALGYLG